MELLQLCELKDKSWQTQHPTLKGSYTVKAFLKQDTTALWNIYSSNKTKSLDQMTRCADTPRCFSFKNKTLLIRSISQ